MLNYRPKVFWWQQNWSTFFCLESIYVYIYNVDWSSLCVCVFVCVIKQMDGLYLLQWL